MTTCMECGENVLDGSENTHKVAGGGWSAKPPKPGCGVVWTHVTSEYAEYEEEVKRMFPGLEYIGV